MDINERRKVGIVNWKDTGMHQGSGATGAPRFTFPAYIHLDESPSGTAKHSIASMA